MRILLLNQCFYPDVVSTAQHLTDLATGLVSRGHSVTVIASDRGYDDPAVRFPGHEYRNGVEIIRIPLLSIGKSSRWRRALNFGSFLFACSLRLLTMRRYDAVVALTSPPLISFLAALFVKLKGGSFYFWVMDLNPDEAIAAGWLEEGSLTSRVLNRMLHYSLNSAAQTVVLDRFMKGRLVARGLDPEAITVVPPWSHDDKVRFSTAGREEFRRDHQFGDRFIVMYSGNHSPCHPLDTLIEAARALESRPDISFCFVGGGSELIKVRQSGLTNLRWLPYQPLSDLSSSLSAADLQVVVMGDKFVGIVHPCKVYNILAVGAPVLYIGPEPSHITDIASKQGRFFETRHGDVEAVVNAILKASESRSREPVVSFGKETLLPQLIALIEARQDLPEAAQRENYTVKLDAPVSPATHRPGR